MILQTTLDQEGRFILCKLQIGETSYCVCNIYAPNCDSPEFYRNVIEQINKIDAHFVMGGG